MRLWDGHQVKCPVSRSRAFSLVDRGANLVILGIFPDASASSLAIPNARHLTGMETENLQRSTCENGAYRRLTSWQKLLKTHCLATVALATGTVCEGASPGARGRYTRVMEQRILDAPAASHAGPDILIRSARKQ